MKQALVVVAVLAVAGACKKKQTAETGTGTGTGTGAVAKATACDLGGEYKLRFRTNGADGWILRLAIRTPATDPTANIPTASGDFTEAQVMLGVDPAPLTAVTLDEAACKLDARGTGRNAGDIGLALTVDPATGRVTGQMTRTQGAPDERAVPVTGWRTSGPPKMPDSCFVPGIYKLQIDPKATWRNAEPDDERSCKGQQHADILVRIDAFGPDLLIDQVGTEPPYDQRWGEETVARSGCEVAFGLVTEEIDLAAKLTFVGGQVMGLVTRARIQVVEETEISEDIWSCTTENASITLTKL